MISQSDTLKIGILLLAHRERAEDLVLQPVFGLRTALDLPSDVTLAVISEKNLEVWGLERVGDKSMITGEQVFTEQILRGNLRDFLAKIEVDEFQAVATSALHQTFQAGLIKVWQSKSVQEFFILGYELGSYSGGIVEDKSTFGSTMYIMAGVNLGAITAPTASRGSEPVKEDLSDYVVHFAHLYLLWIDNGDNDLPVNPQIRHRYSELAAKHPACSIQEEASQWMKMLLRYMEEEQIAAAIQFAVSISKVRWNDDWLSAHHDNLQDFLSAKRSMGPTQKKGSPLISFTTSS